MIDYFKQFFQFIIGFNIIALTSALGLEYFLDLSLCELCYYQRYLFIAATITAIIGVFIKPTRSIATILILLFYLSIAGIALSQVLMEEGYISPPRACTGLIPSGVTDLEVFKSKILDNNFVPCNSAEVRLLNISLAGFSFIAAASMFFFSAVFVATLVLFRYKKL